ATQIEAQRKRVRFGEEEQGSGRSFRRQAETELSGLCKKFSRMRRRSRQPNRSPAQAGSIWRGGARERAQFSPLGGNGAERTLRRRGGVPVSTGTRKWE